MIQIHFIPKPSDIEIVEMRIDFLLFILELISSARADHNPLGKEVSKK